MSCTMKNKIGDNKVNNANSILIMWFETLDSYSKTYGLARWITPRKPTILYPLWKWRKPITKSIYTKIETIKQIKIVQENEI